MIFQKFFYPLRGHVFFVLLVCFFVGANSAYSANAQYSSRLWKIESRADKKIAPSYLFGTMHLADKQIVNLPPHIQQVVYSADTLAIEVKLDAESQRALSTLTALQGDETLSDLIGNTQFKRVAQLLEAKGVSEYSLQRLKPWAAALILNYPPASLDPVLDYSLQLKFSQQNKPVYQLETAQEQIEIFDHLSLGDQISFLEYSLKQQDHFDFYLQKMKQLYLDDDLEGLQALALEQMEDINQPFMLQLFSNLIEKRNIKMVNRMQFHLKAGNSLIAVGALHLTGPKGLINLLRYKGYKVTPVLGIE